MAKAQTTTAPPANTGFAATGVGPTLPTAANVKRGYTKPAAAGFNGRVFTITNAGHAAANAGGIVPGSKAPTVMGIMALAASIAANGGNTATGAAIAAVCLTNAKVQSMLLATKAYGTHFTAAQPAPVGWFAGYINGMARPVPGLAK